MKIRCLLAVLLLFCAVMPAYPIQPSETPSNVVLIGWDGAQLNHVKECLGRGELPNIKKLSEEGAFVEIDVQGHQTETEPGFAQILTGYDDEVSGVITNDRYTCIPKGYTVFERIEDHFGKDNIVTVGLFSKGHRFKSDTPDKPYYNAAKSADVFRNGLGEDEDVAAQAKKMLARYKDRPFFFFVQFADADRKGHAKGENSVEYNDALITYDKLTGDIINELKKLGIYEKTIIYVTADHGFDEGSCGHSYAPYVFMSTNDPRGIRQGFQADVTPTVLDRMGIDTGKINPPLYGKPLTK